MAIDGQEIDELLLIQSSAARVAIDRKNMTFLRDGQSLAK